jgi:hypothetical protein
MRRSPDIAIRAGVMALMAYTLSLSACVDEFDPPRLIACPPADDFRAVSAVVERRCGTLDCHGTLARPLRLYGQTGLRLFTQEEFNDPALAAENGTTPGGSATTDEELEFNRRSICGLEPEKMQRVLNGETDANELMVMTKPLDEEVGGEFHKGGTLFLKGGAGQVCFESWLRGGDVVLDDCADAVVNP